MVAGYLLQNFTNQRVQTVEEAVNLSHLLSDKTKKESANVFYEILVCFFLLFSPWFSYFNPESYVRVLVRLNSLVFGNES